MKFNLKKSAKYIICTLLTLTVVATVVFLPRFYYSVTDNRGSVGNTAETFKLTADITTLFPNLSFVFITGIIYSNL